jgi:hypothetical protein
VKSVCQSWLGAVVGSAKRSAAPRELAVNFTDMNGSFLSEAKRLSALEGPWSDHEPGLHLDEGA